VRKFSAVDYKGVDLLAGGVPCPPFSKAGRQLGESDERDLFPEAIRLTAECEPRAVLLENVRGLLDPVFKPYREQILQSFKNLGYVGGWRLVHASHYGVSQLRPRAIFVAFRDDLYQSFEWPKANTTPPKPVGEMLRDLMAENGWLQANKWCDIANGIAPTLVGGSKKHGGPDLGPTRAKQAWAQLGVDGHGISDAPPAEGFVGLPKLTVRMTARLQGFPDEWQFSGKKTAAYRQIGNAFPPPVAEAIGREIRRTLVQSTKQRAGGHDAIRKQAKEHRGKDTASSVLS